MSRPVFAFVSEVETDAGDYEETEHTLPGKNVVCWRCRGEGRHTNPSVDGHGLSRSDFDEDPDFERDYFRGVYDVSCEVCHGEKVVIEPDESTREEPIFASAWKAYDQYLEDQEAEARWAAEDRHTRRQESGG